MYIFSEYEIVNFAACQWEHVKKHLHSQRTRPQSIKKTYTKYSETKVYTKIFREIFARVSVKNIKTFQKYFLKNIEIFLQNHSFFHLFQAFLVSKTYIFIHVKKTKTMHILRPSICPCIMVIKVYGIFLNIKYFPSYSS